MRTRQPAAWLLAAVLTVAAWVVLAPPSIGGQTSYVVTRGESMRPDFRTGDLALVREAPRYAVGDVIAYRSPTLDVVVLHRIVAAEPGGFRTRGDNNDWTDPDLVPAAQVIGRLWLHVPQVGSVLTATRSAVPVLLAGAAATVLMVPAGPARRRRHPARKVPSCTGLPAAPAHPRSSPPAPWPSSPALRCSPSAPAPWSTPGHRTPVPSPTTSTSATPPPQTRPCTRTGS
ncbi:signal peptidase I [Blastococcus mobilis]|uniref:signal peptidase I n=1 Tax=Blastococcus mobilis TaxID=1938746 RepID=UPI0015956530|nr:signal peptidase I [Blastococcus mobilis]